MRMTQMELEKRTKWILALIALVTMVLIWDFGNLVLTVALVLFIVVFPFWWEKCVRTKLIPYVDSLNKSETRYREDFPTELKVTIWLVVGVVAAAFWTVVVPLIFVLPLWVGYLARNLLGFERLYWGYWQWGWMIAFLVQYLVNFFVGWLKNEYDSFEDRFEYPNE